MLRGKCEHFRLVQEVEQRLDEQSGRVRQLLLKLREQPEVETPESQMRSSFFSKLPPEIRILTYREVLGGHVIHIREDVAKECRMRATSCAAYKHPFLGCEVERSASEVGLLALVLTCRRM
jgi:hypothetical protein